jgi:hypothetical protein
VNREAGGKNRQVKIDSRERGKTKTDRKQIKSFHEGLYNAVTRLKELPALGW